MTRRKPPVPADRIEKRHVRGQAVTVTFDSDGNRTDLLHEFHDYVPVDLLESYIQDAKSHGWQDVRVMSDKHDPGPGGDDGDTHYPEHLARKDQ